MTDTLIYAIVIMVVIAGSVAAAVFAPTQAPAIIGLGTLICVNLLNGLTSKKTADKVETVSVKLNAVEKTTEATHTLTNSGRGALLLLSRSQSRRLADITKDPIDIRDADLADSVYQEHMASQAVVDSGQTLAVQPAPAVPVVSATPGPTPGTLTVPPAAVAADKVEVVITGDDVKVTSADKPAKKK